MNAGSAARVACVVAAAAALAAAPAQAQGPVQLSSTPIPEDQAWKNYVVGTGALDATPVRVSSTSGAVTNADGLVDPSKGPATLTYTAGRPAPAVVLDYGREVGGLPFFTVGGVTPSGTATTVSLRAAYSEARQYLWTAGATTLSLAAAAGDTSIKVGSVSNFVAGDALKVDGETATIASVGTSGAAGTGITLAAPLASAHAAGAAVASTPGAVTGDRNGNNGVGTDPSRADTFNLSAAGTVGNAANQIQGGERFQLITLTTPGTVQLTAAGIHLRHPNSPAADYAGHFLSSDDALNRIWYEGVYTNQTDEVPIGALPNQTVPVILDGAKRDRRPWSGDLSVEGRNAFDSIGFGAKGSDYIKGTIQSFGAAPGANGSIGGQISDWTVFPPRASFYSTSYSIYYVIDLASYYLYSGDTAFAQSQYQTMKNELAYDRTLVNATSGLLTTSSSERDWDFYDGGKPGAVTAYNALYYKALSDAASLASDLAAKEPGNTSASTWQSDAATWAAQAAALKTAINGTLFDSARGVYKLADRDNGTHLGTAVPQDGNSQAISFGIAPASAQAGILSYLKSHLWGTFGPQPYSPDAAYSTVISPFVSGYEVDARFDAGDTAGALALIHNLWDQMTVASGPYYTGTLWEKLNQDGTDVDSNASLAHGWASGPVSSLSGYVLGARPLTPGYKTWVVAPQTGDLKWAQGTVPTPAGPIVSRWTRGAGDSSFTLTMSAPDGTSGTVTVPELGHARTIAMDGTVVWQDGAPVGDVSAVERDGAVAFSGVTGSHTFAFGTVTTSAGTTVGGAVPATLSLTLGGAPSFGTFTPGVEKTYTASTSADVVSTAGDASLSVSDPGHLTNGAFSLPDPLQVSFSRSSWSAPVSHDAVTIGFSQHIGANDALRTGSYAKTLTFTLSTTTP